MGRNHQLALVENKAGGLRPHCCDISEIFEQVLGHPVQVTDSTNIVEDLGWILSVS